MLPVSPLIEGEHAEHHHRHVADARVGHKALPSVWAMATSAPYTMPMIDRPTIHGTK